MGERFLLDLAGEGEVSRLKVDLRALRYLQGGARRGKTEREGLEDKRSAETALLSGRKENIVVHLITKSEEGKKNTNSRWEDELVGTGESQEEIL